VGPCRLQAVDNLLNALLSFHPAVVGRCVPEDMNIPNSLTILRILLIPCYIGLLVYGRFGQALIVLLVAGLTDALDGLIARVTNQHTRLGAVLDPLADKLLLTSGFITLSMIHLVPMWVTILVVSRDVILLLGTAVAHFTESRVDLTPTFLGKGTTFLQLAYVVMVIFLSSRRIDLTLMLPLLFGMISFTLLSGLHYLYRGVRHANTISG
jgi:cardiolipin synthase (CMP-forming)